MRTYIIYMYIKLFLTRGVVVVAHSSSSQFIFERGPRRLTGGDLDVTGRALVQPVRHVSQQTLVREVQIGFHLGVHLCLRGERVLDLLRPQFRLGQYHRCLVHGGVVYFSRLLPGAFVTHSLTHSLTHTFY